jgi:type I restriction enzyme R subunit
MLNEADTRAKLVDPKLHESSWAQEGIVKDRTIAPDRLVDERGNRKKVTR